MNTLQFVDFIFPRFCVHCKNKLNFNEQFLCNGCFDKIKFIDDKNLQIEYSRKFSKDKYIESLYSLYFFENDSPFQSLIHSLKYKGNFRVGELLGSKIYYHNKDKLVSLNIDFIIPAPLHHIKRALRGYNQSFYIAKQLGKLLNIPCNTKIVKRISNKESQTSFNLEQRKKNIKNAFSVINPNLITNKNLLLVDDIITTGATLNECAKTLKEAAECKIYVISSGIPTLTY